jgi:hypothetical protein
MTFHSNAFLFTILACCATSGCLSQDEQAEPLVAEEAMAPSEAEFTSVFNGTDLTGWTGSTSGYGVEDGHLVCFKEGGGNLYLADDYSDFAFRFEFKLEPNGNNGVGIRAVRGRNAAYEGMEIQILDNAGDQYRQLQPYQYHGSVYGVAPALRGYQMPVGEWNTEEIRAEGGHIQVTLNDQVIVDVDLEEVGRPATMDGNAHPGLFNESGAIGFLGHGHRIEFRNLRIQEL